MRVLQTKTFSKWFERVRDRKAKFRVLACIDTLAAAGYSACSDWRHLGCSLIEIRIHAGAGYRLYLTQWRNDLILLLVGGDKSTQKRDIARARQMIKNWRENDQGQ